MFRVSTFFCFYEQAVAKTVLQFMPKLLDLAHRSTNLCMRPRVPRFAAKRLETVFDTLSNVYLAATHDGVQLPLLKSDLLLAVLSHQPTIHASVLRVLLVRFFVDFKFIKAQTSACFVLV